MVCQYSTRGFVSSEKHDRAVDPGAAEGGGDASDIATGTVMVVGSRALPEPFTAITLMANPMNVLRSRTPARLYVCEAVLERLAQDLEPMASEPR
jgi:hypothetical protein